MPAEPPPLPPRLAAPIDPRDRDTPRDGGLLAPPQSPYEVRELINGLRKELLLHREALSLSLPPLAPSLPSPVPPSLRTRSRTAVAGLATGKYAALFLVGGVVLRAVAKHWPQFGDVIEGILQGMGL